MPGRRSKKNVKPIYRIIPVFLSSFIIFEVNRLSFDRTNKQKSYLTNAGTQLRLETIFFSLHKIPLSQLNIFNQANEGFLSHGQTYKQTNRDFYFIYIYHIYSIFNFFSLNIHFRCLNIYFFQDKMFHGSSPIISWNKTLYI